MRKKLLFVLLPAAVLCAVLAAVFLTSDNDSGHFESGAFTLIGGRPYILSGGSAYYLNTENEWGFNYCAGLTSRGEILYADNNGDRKARVTDLLKSKTAEHIACSYQTLALLNADGSVEIIDLEKIR